MDGHATSRRAAWPPLPWTIRTSWMCPERRMLRCGSGEDS